MPHWPKVLGVKPIYYDLERINILMQRLGSPQLKLPPVIHIAGTNGKGSTTAFMRSILEAAGYKVHVYTSPHLVNFNERIVLAGNEISNDYLTQIMEECRIAAEDLTITFFEGTTAGAFLAFAKNNADILLLETGMGGRLDATNLVPNPVATVITPISMDHTEYLGPTISTIAREKAGIIKNGAPCIVASQTEEAHQVLEAEAEKLNVELVSFGYDWIVEKNNDGSMNFKDKNHELANLPEPALKGDHQLINSGTAIATLLQLKNFNINRQHIESGLKNVKWPARMQQITNGNLLKHLPENSEIWVDGAHNEAGFQVLSCTLSDLPKMPTYVICGFSKGRQAENLLKHLIGKAKLVIGVLIHTEPGCQNPKIVAKQAETLGFKAASFESVEEALDFIGKSTGTEPARAVFCGSLYLASDVFIANKQ